MNLEHLNEKQRETVLMTEGTILVLAGAGSGKTGTMTHRMAYLLEKGVPQNRILAVTFTNKAAEEMRDRVEQLADDCSNMWICTFHSMCLKMLRVNCEKIGYTSNFVIYDTADQKTLAKNILKELQVDDKKYTPQYILGAIEKIKERGKLQLEEDSFDSDIQSQRIISSAYEMYEKELKKNNAMDFNDLLLNVLKLFKEAPDVLLHYQTRFQYIMVDEYQDTNMVQYKIIKNLAKGHNNLCVVGDDDQCIYEWRGADITNILNFEKDFPDTKVIKLEQNYRSCSNIINAAHSVINYNVDRKEKKLWTTKESGEKISYKRAVDEKEEAQYIAHQIALLKGDKKYSDFAVLYRMNAQSRNFEEAFTHVGIPYRVLSGTRYYDRKEIKDMMSYLRLLVNQKDDLAFRRIINEPKRGIGQKALEKISEYATKNGLSLFESISSDEVIETMTAKTKSAVIKFCETIKKCESEKDHIKVSELYDILLTDTEYLKMYADVNTVEAETRLQNLLEFKSVIIEYERETENPTIEELMEKLTLMTQVDNLDDSEDAVVLMTIHGAKGLEFPTVFLPGLEEGLFPGSRAHESETGIEEERRLCYVAITRAKEKLIITSAASRMLYGKTNYTRESQFLHEIDEKYLTGDKVYKGHGRPGVSTGEYYDGADRYSSYTGFRNNQSYSSYGGGFGGNNKISSDNTRAVGSTQKNYNPSAKSYSPFSVTHNKMQQNRNSQTVALSVGDRVSHIKFGDGTVSETTDKIVTVDFDNGEVKKLAIGIAPLTKI